MTDAEKAALEWLDVMIDTGIVRASKVSEHSRTLKRLLAEPRLPEEPSDAMLVAIANAGTPNNTEERHRGWPRRSYRALYAHLTKPKTKTVWRVIEPALPDSIDYVSLEDALGRAKVVVERHRQSVTIEPVEVPA